MSNNINLKKGLDIPVTGAASPVVSKTVVPGICAVRPSDFKGFNPRLLVREGDKVLAGSPVMSDKKNPEILVTSPLSGTVKEIVRGDKRKLLAVLVQTDKVQESIDFEAAQPDSLSAEQVRTKLLKSGLWASIIQRPYGIVADPAASVKAIFVSAFSTAPLAADTEFTLGDRKADIQAGLDALSKLSEGGVHVCVNGKINSTFASLKGVKLHSVCGKHPAGNVGVQISHISPILKEETVWTVSLQNVAAIGRLFLTGKVDLRRKVAVCGPMAIEPSYVETFPGMSVMALAPYYGGCAEGIRFISGDILTGENVGEQGYLGFFSDQITLIREGDEKEYFGWIRPIRYKQFSTDHCYFSWLMPWRKYDMTTNLHGGPRAFLVNDAYYAKVLPMDIYPLYLTKACLAGDIDKMEKFGIYEVLPEDLALCEFVDPSKNYIQDIIAKGIDLMLKEMA